jgi:AcrR family transcriptional regulator
MPAQSVPVKSDTKRKLLVTAIKLFANHGIEAVSLRQINEKAGARNASAINYYFGNKRGVLEAVLDFHHQVVGSVQRRNLRQLRSESLRRKLEVREVIEALFLPHIGLILNPEFGWHIIKFYSRLVVEAPEDFRDLVFSYTKEIFEEAVQLIAQALPGKPLDAVKADMLFSLIAVTHGLGDIGHIGNSPVGEIESDDPLELLNDLFDFLAAGFHTPRTEVSAFFRQRIADAMTDFDTEEILENL